MLKQSLPADIEAGFNAFARTLPTAARIRDLARLRARAEVRIERARERGDVDAEAAELEWCRRFLADASMEVAQ